MVDDAKNHMLLLYSRLKRHKSRLYTVWNTRTVPIVYSAFEGSITD